MEGPPIDLDAFYEPSMDGRLMDLLVKLPRERWAERDKYGRTLLCRTGVPCPSISAWLQ